MIAGNPGDILWSLASSLVTVNVSPLVEADAGGTPGVMVSRILPVARRHPYPTVISTYKNAPMRRHIASNSKQETDDPSPGHRNRRSLFFATTGKKHSTTSGDIHSKYFNNIMVCDSECSAEGLLDRFLMRRIMQIMDGFPLPSPTMAELWVNHGKRRQCKLQCSCGCKLSSMNQTY